ncbi:MAG: NAD(P)-dependent oxidoreductase [Candidatus Gracilibacteria bacterium]
MGQLQTAFEMNFDVTQYPEPSNRVAFVDGVSGAGIVLARSIGLDPVDLRDVPIDEALRQIMGMRVSAVLGRGELDKALEGGGSERFENLADLVIRLGNGVGMNRQAAFDAGTVIERTPRGNAEAVRIWQDLTILELLKRLEKIEAVDGENNPALADDNGVKGGKVKKMKWDRDDVTDRVNPKSFSKTEMTSDHMKMADVFAGKKVAVIGLGKIGAEVISRSPFLQKADVHVFDPNILMSVNGSKRADSLKSALDGAELVLLHLDGNKELIGKEQLKLLKKGAIVCNMARGKVVNPQALYEAIESGHVAGAGLDTHFVEGKDLDAFGKEHNRDDWKLGDYAVALRGSNLVVATNHSAASDETAQKVNAEDGVTAASLYLKFGQIVDGMNVPNIGFPFRGGFVGEADGGGVQLLGNVSMRVAIENIHDGNVSGLLAEVQDRVRQSIVVDSLNKVAGHLEAIPVDASRHSVDFSVFDLEGIGRDVDDVRAREVLKRIHHAAMSVSGVRKVRVFYPQLKKAA